MAVVDTASRVSDTSTTTTSTMMDRPDYGQQTAQESQLQQQLQLYQELKFRFPGASQAVLMGTMQRHGNHRERCLDELTLFCRSSYQPGQWPPQLQMPQPPSQQVYGNQQFTKVTPASRSRSVSGVPGADGTHQPYGFRYTSDEAGCPQTAPVMSMSGGSHAGSSYASPVYYFQSPAPPPPLPAPMQHSASYSSVLSPPLPKPPRPPVPPPTYRSHLEQRQHLVEDQSSPVLPLYPGLGAFPRNVMVPPAMRHNMSLNFSPVYPNLRGIYNEWESEQQQQHVQQHGWTGGLQISPSSMVGITSGVQQQTQQQQHQSTLHISVSPNGYSIPGATSPSGSNSATKPSGLPKLQFKRRESSHGDSDKSQARNQQCDGSNRKMECPFDVDDPEQENLSHKPLRPLPSPTTGAQSSASGSGSTSSSAAAAPSWPSVMAPVRQQPSNEGIVVQDDEAFTNALIVHQKERLTLLLRELSHESQLLQEALAEVTNLEHQLFRRRTRFHDQVFPTFDDIQRLWSEIRSYSVDCECMSHVVDHLHKGQVPLGETNEDFYKSINTGQQDLPVLQPPTVARQGGSPTPLAVCNGPTSVSPIPTALCSDHDGIGHANAAAAADEERDKWSCSACTFLNDHALERCEMCEMPRVVLGGMHNLRIHVRQSPNCTTATNKALQLKLTHKLGLPKLMH